MQNKKAKKVQEKDKQVNAATPEQNVELASNIEATAGKTKQVQKGVTQKS